MAFRNYTAGAEESLRDALALNGQELCLFERALLIFPDAIFVGEMSQPPEALFLAANSHSLLLAAGRISVTGHASAMFPVLRAALESASYCFLMVKNPSLSEVWRERHSSPVHKSACRKAFNGAIKAVAEQSRWTAEAKDYLNRLYEAMIDNGAHPNPNSIFNSTDIEDGDDHWHVHLNSLYEADAPMTRWAVFVCAETTLLVASVLAECLKTDDKSAWECIDSATQDFNAYRAATPQRHRPDM